MMRCVAIPGDPSGLRNGIASPTRNDDGETVWSTTREPTGIVFVIEPVTITMGWSPSASTHIGGDEHDDRGGADADHEAAEASCEAPHQKVPVLPVTVAVESGLPARSVTEALGVHWKLAPLLGPLRVDPRQVPSVTVTVAPLAPIVDPEHVTVPVT